MADSAIKSVAETQEQRALSIVRRIGRKLRQHASSSEHFTNLFVKMDVDRTGYLSADEIGLGMWQLGLELSAADLTCLFDTVDTQYVGRISIAKFMLLVQRGAGVDAAEPQAGVGAAGAHSPAEGEGDDEAILRIPEHHFAVEPVAVPADFKRAIAEGSPAHAAVAKIVSALDERKIQLKAAFQNLDRDGDGSISAQDLPEGLAKIGVYISPTRAAKLVRTFDRTGDGRLHYDDFIRLLSHTRAEEHEAKSAQTRRQSQPLSQSPPAPEPEPEPESAEGGEGEGELVAAGTTDDGIAEEEAVDEESVSDVLAAISFSVYSRFRGARKAFEHFDRAGNKAVSKAEMEAALRKAGVECFEAELDAIYKRFDLDGTGTLSFPQFIKLLAAAAAADHA